MDTASLISGSPKKTNHWRMAGFASLVCALCYATGLVTVFFIEPGINSGAEQRLQFIQSSGHLLQAWYFVIFVCFGVSITLLNMALRQWLLPSPSALLQTAFISSFVWSAYIFSSGLISILTIQYLLSVPADEQRTIWYAIYSVQSGLGEGVEWVGGIWMLFLNLYLRRERIGLQWLNSAGVAVGLCGTLTMLPGMWIAGALFGLSQMMWFISWSWLFLTGHHSVNNQTG